MESARRHWTLFCALFRTELEREAPEGCFLRRTVTESQSDIVKAYNKVEEREERERSAECV